MTIPVTSATQPMTFDEMIDHAFFMADYQESDVFTRARVGTLVNLGIARVAKEGGVGLFDMQTTVAADGGDDSASYHADYALVDPLLANGDALVQEVRLDDTRLTPILPTSLPDILDTGTPYAYYIIGETLYVYPTFTELDLGKTLSVLYRKQQALLVNGTDMPDLNRDACETVAIYAAWQMCLKDQEYDTADRLRAQFLDGLTSSTQTPAGVY